jgi:hypothetical protein
MLKLPEMVGAFEPFVQYGHARVNLLKPVVPAIHKAQLHNPSPVVWVRYFNKGAPCDEVRHVIQIT